MARTRRDQGQEQRQPQGEAGRPPGPVGPRGGLAGASDDFARYAEPSAGGDPEWAGWTAHGVYGRGAADDRTDHGAPEAPALDERIEQDYGSGPDRDFGGRDTAAWYARHGGNADRLRARRRWQARHAEDDPVRGPEIDRHYHLSAGARHEGAHYQPAPRGQDRPHERGAYGPDYGAHAGDYGDEGDDPYLAWPGHDVPGGRGLTARAWGAAPGQPGLAEPGYGSSPTRQADSMRGLAPAGYRRADARIEEDLCERLTEDPWVDASDVALTVTDGRVQLSGSVAERAMKHRIEDICAVCPGVTGIENAISVRQRAYTRADQRWA